jgi:hypothetical protein
MFLRPIPFVPGTAARPATLHPWMRGALFALGLGLFPFTPLLAQAAPSSAEALNYVVRDIRGGLQSAARADSAEQHLLMQAGAIPASAGSGSVMEFRVFSAARVRVDPEARALLDAVNARVDGALQSLAGAPATGSHPTAAQILNASLTFTAAVAKSGVEGGVVTAQDVNAALTGICPLYPIC